MQIDISKQIALLTSLQTKDDFKRLCGAIYFQFCFLGIGALVATHILYNLFFHTDFYWIVALYIAYYSYSITHCYNGGYYNEYCRNWRIWTCLIDYFPLKLIKTVDLDPNENYIFGIHPHGIMATSCFGHFCTDASGFSKLFPGLKSHVLTLKWLFYLPYTRELLLLSGASAVTEDSFKKILCNDKKGEACVVVPGGAAESLEAKSNNYKLILKTRKGFVRIAIQTGAQIVPVFTFGENELFNTLPNPDDSLLRNLQEKLKKKTAIGFPMWYGRGFWEGSFGFFPFKKTTYTVVGKPIPVTKNVNPDKDEINEMHQLYVEELIKLFEENKEKYDNKSATIEII